ncbi:MAG: luciferase family protein [Anaerolineales bacterium]
MRGAKKRIVAEVTGWPGISTEPGRFGATAFVLEGAGEVGHIHGDAVVDVPCRKAQCAEWIAAGRAERHRFAPGFGVSVFIKSDEDVNTAVALMREVYEKSMPQ